MPSFSGTHLVISTMVMDDHGLMVSDAADITNNVIIHGMDFKVAISPSTLGYLPVLLSVKTNQIKYSRLVKLVMVISSV